MLRASPYPGRYHSPVPIICRKFATFRPPPSEEEGKKEEKKKRSSLADAGGVWFMQHFQGGSRAEFVPLVTKAHTRQGRLCDHRFLFLGVETSPTKVCLFRPKLNKELCCNGFSNVP